MKRSLVSLVVALVAMSASAGAEVMGGGPARTDCLGAWQVTTPETKANRGAVGIDCQDGDPACDVDGAVNGVCAVGISACVNREGVAGCAADVVTGVTFNRRASQLGVTAPVLPAGASACGEATIVSLPLRQTPRGYKPSRPVMLAMTVKGASTDRDRVRLRCVPNGGAGQCPANPAGGPRELNMVVAASGTDLDNGVSGNSHNFPVPSGSTLRMCLTDCDAATDSVCVQDEAATDVVKSPTFGPPIPLFSAGAPVCIVNRFATPSFTGGVADLASGAVAGDLHLLTDVYLTTATGICPRCSASAPGKAGTCDSGRRQGQACRTESLLDVKLTSGHDGYALSSDCPPTGAPVGTLTLTLPVTTASSTLPGPLPCGAKVNDACGTGTCDAACTGSACVATTPDGQCVDAKGGVSQVCCSNNTQTPCFPTGSGAGAIVRVGGAAVPQPAWPDPTYPKTAGATLVATFCEPATGSNVVDFVSGLPGAGALVLPVTQTWVP
ncbi:MAG TPA: hypothetical protein VMS22_00125 [Candidatus Eisenbacteria bacterium]|nr:hypothetical protein [Candidatus Eisenbacteria bacterium]